MRILAILGWLSLSLVVWPACRRETPPAADRSPAPAHAPADGASWFSEITSESGLSFTHESGAQGRRLLPEVIGPGVAFFDFDNDGELDVYLINGHRGLPHSMDDETPTNRLFRGEAHGSYTDVTNASGLDNRGYGMGVAVGDVDNDGDRDLFASNYGQSRFYRNRGDGTFEDLTAHSAIGVDGWAVSSAFCDFDRDGFLDLYVVRYVNNTPEKDCFDHAGRPDYCDPRMYPPVHDVLLHNEGDGTFSDVSRASGIADIAAPGLGVVCDDFNDDGWIDIYVANDGAANQLWINQKDGTFRDDALLTGTALNLHGQPEAGMGVAAADFDADLDLDLFMTHLAEESNTFYRNLGRDAGFIDASAETGLGWSSVPYTGFGIAAFDVELDADLDIFLVNGRVTRGVPHPRNELPPPWDVLAEPNLFYLNDGTGRFEPLVEPVKPLCAPVEISRGVAVGDIDDDGDLDILVGNVQGPARLYRNDAPRSGHWLLVRAIDPRLERDAVGARILVTCGDRRILRTVNPGGSYLSSSDPRAHFGLGPCARVERIDVRWPDGRCERFPPPPVDRHLELLRGTGKTVPCTTLAD